MSGTGDNVDAAASCVRRMSLDSVAVGDGAATAPPSTTSSSGSSGAPPPSSTSAGSAGSSPAAPAPSPPFVAPPSPFARAGSLLPPTTFGPLIIRPWPGCGPLGDGGVLVSPKPHGHAGGVGAVGSMPVGLASPNSSATAAHSAAVGASLAASKRVAVFNTGGTIGMKAGPDGSLEPCPGYLAERMLAMPEFSRPEMPGVALYELLPLIDSSDMGPEDWIRIAHAIEAVYHEYDAFVVIMGTDTMSYAASALSFILESLAKPVILTGSMLPLIDLLNDAQRNLISALVLAATLDIPEVCIWMESHLLRGNRTVKVNSSGLDAFESPNFPPLARLETGIRYRPSLALPRPTGRFRVHGELETRIACWRMVPGFDDGYLHAAIANTDGLRAIVLELYGTGNVSSRKSTLIDALHAAIGRGILVVASSQCLRGTVDLGAYALGRRLQAIGVISALDTTVEGICAKLAYLLSWAPPLSPAQVAAHMARSLRGEVTEPLSPMALGSAGLNASITGAAGGGAGALTIAAASGGDVRISMEHVSMRGSGVGGGGLPSLLSAASVAAGVGGATVVAGTSGASAVFLSPAKGALLSTTG